MRIVKETARETLESTGKEKAKRGKIEKTIWFAALELLLVTVGFFAELPMAFIFAFVVMVYIFSASSIKGASIDEISLRQKVGKERISEEEELTVEETVRNEGRRPVFLEVLTALPEELFSVEGSNHYITYLKGKETRRIRYRIKTYYTGNFVIPRVSMRALNFFLGLIDEDERKLGTRFAAYPMLEELRRFPARRINVEPLHGVIPSRSPGPGTEFFEIRNYVPTDEFRRINWKAYARVGTLLSNEYEFERMADVYLILDSTESSGPFLRDYIKACASIGNYFLRSGNRVGLVAIGKFWTWIRSGSGRKQLVRLVDNLIDQRPEDPSVFSYQIENTLRTVPRASTIIFLSSMRDARFRELVRMMTDRKHKILAIIPTWTADYLKTSSKDPRKVTMAKKLIQLERKNILLFLARINVTPIEWDPRLSLTRTMEALGRWTAKVPVRTK